MINIVTFVVDVQAALKTELDPKIRELLERAIALAVDWARMVDEKERGK